MNPETETKLVSILESLASKVGSTVEYRWPQALYYVRVEGITDVIVSLVGIALTVLGARWLYQRKAAEDWMDNDFLNFLKVFGIAAAVLIIGVLLLHVVPEGLQKALAPEGYLITKVITAVGK